MFPNGFPVLYFPHNNPMREGKLVLLINCQRSKADFKVFYFTPSRLLCCCIVIQLFAQATPIVESETVFLPSDIPKILFDKQKLTSGSTAFFSWHGKAFFQLSVTHLV